MRRVTTVGLALTSFIAFTMQLAPARGQVRAPAPSGPRVDQRAPAQAALKQRMPEIKISGATLGDAIDFIRDASGANIHVNWRALEEVNVTRDMPVSMRLGSVPVRQVLRLLLADVGSGLLTFYADDGVIEVTTRELADKQLITRVYPVEDLVMEIPNFNEPPDFQIQASQTGRGGGSGGQSIFQGNINQDDRSKTEAQRGQELVDLIMETIQPEIWRENGGTASVRYFRGKLIVTAPRSVQEAIGGPIQ